MAKIHSREYQGFLKKLRKAREEAGLSQEAAARKLNTYQEYVSRSETGERRMDFIDLAVFAQAYGKPLDYFLPPSLKLHSKPGRKG